MALGKRLINTGAAAAACNTDSTDPFGDSSGVLLYSMDYDASDASGTADGSPTDVTFGVEGQINTGARFNGSSSYIQTSLSLNAASNSVSFWFNADSVGSQNPALYFNNRGGRIDIIINGTSSNTPTHYYESIFINSTTAITGWNFVSIVFTGWASSYSAGSYGSAITANVYLNGGSAVSLSPTPYGQSDGLRIGRSGGSYYYDGDIDQVRIFNKALDSTEVGTLYAETACVYTATTTDNNYPVANTMYYKLDNNAIDETGTSTATEQEMQYRFGKYGQAGLFSGVSNGSEINTNYTTGDTTLTHSIWMNQSGIGFQGFNTVLGAYWDGTTPYHLGYYMWTTATTINWRVFYGGDGGSTSQKVEASGTITQNQWHHIVATWTDGTGAKLYIDGDLAQSVSSSETRNKNGINVAIGGFGHNRSGNANFKGLLDTYRYFNSELSASQVTELYNEKPEVDTSNFKAVLYEGDSSTSGNYISNVGFQPDLTWIKFRNISVRHLITDSITGPSVYQGAGITNHSNETFASNTYGEFTSFDANGFTVRYWGGSQYFNTSGNDYVAWNWKGGGDAVNIGVNSITGSTPSIASDVSANTAAGFSVVKVTNHNNTQTIAHGLSQAPEVIFQKITNSSGYGWYVYHKDVGNDKYLQLNTTAAAVSDNFWDYTDPTDTVFTHKFSTSSFNMIFYCWHSVAGYSKIGTYSGNSSTNKITLDFAPSWVMIKLYDVAGGNWFMYDNKRNPSNPADLQLEADTANQDTDHGTAYELNFLSDGFELQGAGGAVNFSGRNYLYMAFK